ncbi:TPA: type 1 fimbrial protein [Enterobacter hormaechei]|nr:type 1 fimbrial protein [Enterobacter hormaechei]
MSKQHRFLRKISAMSSILSIALFYCTSAKALVTCSSVQVNNISVPEAPDFRNFSIPILGSGITVSALRDLPVGEELFQQHIARAPAIYQPMRYMDCTSDSTGASTFSITSKVEFEGGPPATVTTINGRKVYETGIQGIGYSLTHGTTITTAVDLPRTMETVLSTEVAFGGIAQQLSNSYLYFRLIKTGDIPAGTWTVPINIPAIITWSEPGQNMAANFNLNSDRITISGSINVVAGSCQTPDVNVQLGEYEITDEMQRTSWHSPWKEFNIQLINCPVIAGRYNDKSANWAGEGSINTYVNDPDYPGVIAYRLDPVGETGFTPVGETCLKTDPAANGAEGICIHIDDPAIENGIYTNALDNSWHNWRGKAFLNQYYIGSDATSYTIPLRARYSRLRSVSGSTVVPLKAGPANAAAEFTIFYE